MSIARTVLALSAAAVAAVGCTRAAKPAAAATVPVEDGTGFRAELREVSLAARRSFHTTADARSTPPSATLTVSVALAEFPPGRLARVRQGSGLVSVLDDRGLELLEAGVAGLFAVEGASEFTVTAPSQYGRSGRNFQVAVPVGRLPARLARISGVLHLEVAETEEVVVVPLPEPGQTQEVDGLRASAPLFMLDETTRAPRQVVIQLDSPLPSDPAAPAVPHIHSAELVDELGVTVAALRRSEEYAVGDTLRRRFTLETDRSARPDRNAPTPGPAAAVRLRLFTAVRLLRLPFEWGPVPIVGAGCE